MMKNKLYSLLLLAGIFFSCNDFLGVEQTGMVIPQTLEDYKQMLTYPLDVEIENTTFMVPELYVSDEVLPLLDNSQSNGYRW